MKLASFPALVFLILAMLTFNACSSDDANLAGEWVLVSYGSTSSPTPALPDVDTSLSFGADGQFGGTVGCNSFGGGYKAGSGTVKFEGIISTLMYCEGVSDQESAVLGMLSDKSVKYSIDGTRLTLTSEDGSLTVVLEKK
ncbi:MAG TPA: META domain-containing protein [Anaerolineales bacterium]|nr:META domain-containing protein [Anaerolineales bacterium]